MSHSFEFIESLPFEELSVPAKTTLLEAGAVAQNFYYIKQGAVRLWFNSDGKEITLQLFFENQGVARRASFRSKRSNRLRFWSTKRPIYGG